MNTKGPLTLSREEARKIEHAILILQPFPKQSWISVVENYLILRWTLGLGPATVREIVDALERAQFWYTLRPDRRELPFNSSPSLARQQVPRHRFGRASLASLPSPPIRLAPKQDLKLGNSVSNS